MNDLVERLRKYCDEEHHEAAAEIERLRERVVELERVRTSLANACELALADRDAARAEATHYSKALIEASDYLARLGQDRDAARAEAEALRKDAERWRAVVPHLGVAREQIGDWTCWLEFAECVPFRSQTTDPADLADRLVAIYAAKEGT